MLDQALLQIEDGQQSLRMHEAVDFDAVSGCVDERDGAMVAVVAVFGVETRGCQSYVT
jgi:hypothetical protein